MPHVSDAHVDVLMKLERDEHLAFTNGPLDASCQNLRLGSVKTQVFALYVHPEVSPSEQLLTVLRQIDAYYNRVASCDGMRTVTSRQSLLEARSTEDIACLLSLEGAACLHGDPALLRTLYALGVRGVGLTWNDRNDLADGCKVPDAHGLTRQGKKIVQEMERLQMWIDIAHLADSGVRDVFSVTDGIVMASHANSRRVWNHPRNLTDETIRELISRHGFMGLTFEASFVGDGAVCVEDLLLHIDHALDLGAEHILGFGSDFDGALNKMEDLRTAADYPCLAERLVSRYGEYVANKLMFQNFEDFLHRQLPRE